MVRATGGRSKLNLRMWSASSGTATSRIAGLSPAETDGPRNGSLAVKESLRLQLTASMSLQSSGAEALEADLETEDEEVQEELLAAYEAQKKAKGGVKKHFKNYRDQRRKVREIRKTRQPYMPVVALAPDWPVAFSAAAAAGHSQLQPTFRYDRKGKPDGKNREGIGPRT